MHRARAAAADVAVDLTEQLLRALGYAHKRGIVHRDVKPQNVILDAEGQAKVADFGIARAANSEMTQTGAIVGTVQYLSPEQAQGQPVDRRSDLYSAGVVLYELLTGRVPFDGEAPVSIALKHVSERPVPPSQLRPGIPPALEAVVLRALEKDPALPLPERRGVHRGARERAPRADAPDRARARRAVGRARAGLALVDVAARRRSCSSRSPSAPGSCSPAKGDGAERRRARGERGRRRSCTTRGLEVAFVNVRVRRGPARRGDLAGSRSRRGGARGHDDHAHGLRRARHRRRCPTSWATRARTPSRRCATPASRPRSRRRSRTPCRRAT